MRYNKLGNTGLYVSELCLGTMTFESGSAVGAFKAMAEVDQDGADAIVKRSLDAGINFIDTADVYSAGDSERMLGQALRNLEVPRKDVVIATKLNSPTGTGPNDRGLSRKHVMDAIEASLERLQVDYIDLYQVHGTDPATPVEETLRAFDDLVSRGLVRYIGASNWWAWRVAKANAIAEKRGWARFESVQSYYSVAGRDLERETVPMLLEDNVGCLVWSPLAGGLLSGKYSRDGGEGRRSKGITFPPVDEDRAWASVDVMREIADKHGSTVATVALAYCLAKPWVTSVLIGANRMDQLEQNLAAVDLTLDDEDLARLDEVSELPVEYPGWLINFHLSERAPKPFVPQA